MKYIVIVPDGAADYPLEILGGKTPLEAAETPNMDSLASKGVIGRAKTVPEGFRPASDVANLSLLGYSPELYYTGRAPFEAANIGVELGEKDIAFRCNFITAVDGKLFDYSAGHISTRESHTLVDYLNQHLSSDRIKFYAGVSYRNLMVYKEGLDLGLDKIECFPPHDIMGKLIDKYLPRGKAAREIIALMKESEKLLEAHEVNSVRIDLKENPANMIWLWGQGKKPQIEDFVSRFGLRGGVISAVDLIKGIGKTIGLEVIEVEGATGYYDTNYAGKAEAAIEALKRLDFVYIHIEAPDEAGHNEDTQMKIISLERIDKLVVGKILEKFSLDEVRILIAPDHFTPISLRTHSPEPVPFLVAGKNIPHSGAGSFCERQAQESSLFFEDASGLINYLIKE